MNICVDGCNVMDFFFKGKTHYQMIHNMKQRISNLLHYTRQKNIRIVFYFDYKDNGCFSKEKYEKRCMNRIKRQKTRFPLYPAMLLSHELKHQNVDVYFIEGNADPAIASEAKKKGAYVWSKDKAFLQEKLPVINISMFDKTVSIYFHQLLSDNTNNYRYIKEWVSTGYVLHSNIIQNEINDFKFTSVLDCADTPGQPLHGNQHFELKDWYEAAFWILGKRGEITMRYPSSNAQWVNTILNPENNTNVIKLLSKTPIPFEKMMDHNIALARYMIKLRLWILVNKIEIPISCFI